MNSPSSTTPSSEPRQALGEILENRRVAPFTWIMKVHAPDVAPTMQPGQFVNLRTSPSLVPLLRRPMSIHRIIRHGGTATGFCVLYDVIGPGTEALSRMRATHKIDFLGPLGNAISVPSDTRRAVLVAGGIGAGPIKIVAESLQERGLNDITVCYGARDGDHCVPTDDLAPNGCRVLVCTDDGSVGRKGRVTDFVEALLEGERLTPGDYVFACGPVPMFRSLQGILGPRGVACEAATEEYMGCGFGVCFGCNLRQRQPDGSVEYRLCCVDGCIFPLNSLVFECDPA